MMPFSLREPWLHWCSTDFPPKQQFDAWCAALNESHLEWILNKPDSLQFSGEIKMRHIGGIRVLHCRCEPCDGRRTKREIRQSEEEYFGLLLIYEGHELVRCGEKVAQLDKSSIVLWDSTHPVEFHLGTGLKKVTLLVPQYQLRNRFPHVDNFVGEKIDLSSGLGAVAASHIAALGSEAYLIESGWGDSIVDLTLELIATCLQAKQPRPVTKARRELFADIRNYIENTLDDPDLGPGSVAARFGISSRYLHLLFEDAGVSVSNWILHRRLEQCRRELVRIKPFRSSITKIAFRWGFNDSAHFSRSFKKFYGLSPSDYQKRHFCIPLKSSGDSGVI